MTFAEEDGTVLYCTVKVMVLVRYGLEAESFISLGGYIRVFSSLPPFFSLERGRGEGEDSTWGVSYDI